MIESVPYPLSRLVSIDVSVVWVLLKIFRGRAARTSGGQLLPVAIALSGVNLPSSKEHRRYTVKKPVKLSTTL